MAGPRTFGELRAGLPTLSAKVLTERGLLVRPLLDELYRTGAALLT